MLMLPTFSTHFYRKDYECKNRATVSSAPPHFANGFQCPTTAYDTIEDVYERQKRNQPGYVVKEVDYNKHIYPLFQRIYMISWSNRMANRGHGVLHFPGTSLADIDRNIAQEQ